MHDTCTLETIPDSARLFWVYVTGDQIDLDDADPVPASGWVDWSWNPEDLHESINDAAPLARCSSLDVDVDDEDMDTWPKVIMDAWLDALRHVGSVAEDDHGYSVDHEHNPPTSSLVTTYNLHAIVSERGVGARQWKITGLPTTTKGA